MERQQGNRTTVARLTDTASYAKHAGSSNSALSKEAPMSKFARIRLMEGGAVAMRDLIRRTAVAAGATAR